MTKKRDWPGMTDFMTPERLAAFTDESIDAGEYCPQDVFDLRDALLAALKERDYLKSRLDGLAFYKEALETAKVKELTKILQDERADWHKLHAHAEYSDIRNSRLTKVNARLVEALTDLLLAAEPCMVAGRVIRRAKEDNSILTVEMDIDRLVTLTKAVKKVAEDIDDLIVDEVTRRALEFVNGA